MDPEQNPIIDSLTGERLTVPWVETQIAKRGLIPLIKALRSLTGEGLKDSKDRVDAIFMLPPQQQVPKALELFAPWLDLKKHLGDIAKLRKEQEKAQRQAERKAQREREQAERKANQDYQRRRKEMDKEGSKIIMAAMECVCKNWHTLGFNDKLTGCHSILRNFKDKLPPV
jgi:hypothetical protein